MANSGEWLVTIVDANVLKGFDLFSKSDLYVKIKIGDNIYKTKTCKNESNPAWNESFRIPMNSINDVELEVMDDDIFKDDKVGMITIYRDQFPTSFGEEKEYSIPLCYKNKDIGILHIRIKNNHVGNNMNQNISYSGQERLRNDNNNFSSYSNDINSTNNRGAMGGAIMDYKLDKNNNSHNLRDEDYKDRMPTVDNNYNTTQLPTNTLHSGNNPNLIGTSEYVHSDLTDNDKIKKKDKKDKKHKHKHDHDDHHRKVILPEKHHHYEDGYSTSTSESSNEGERRRASEGKLGTHESTANTNTKTTSNDYNTTSTNSNYANANPNYVNPNTANNYQY